MDDSTDLPMSQHQILKEQLKERIALLEQTVASQAAVITQLQTEISNAKNHSSSVQEGIPQRLDTFKYEVLPVNTFTVSGTTITRVGNRLWSSIFLDHPITKGICRCSFEIGEKSSTWIYFGIVDSSLTYTHNRQPLGNGDRDVVSCGYRAGTGEMFHKNQSEFFRNKDEIAKQGDIVTMELNMDTHPHTLHYFVNKRQCRNAFLRIPDTVKIGLTFYYHGDSVKLTSFGLVDTPMATSESLDYPW
ncbi:hypothetical protein BLNAU_252 [Blattamonas nauphoetae]|uniref:B30.2/SPRY domain-containing protein n=1 Tax=Blattamonas nauphoetae TaxID=2049346 RepID=A0ABQ9YMF9_9EUKA|nr:hypothetical protein BLNAU_252 [Blattamonas nauphoetae]